MGKIIQIDSQYLTKPFILKDKKIFLVTKNNEVVSIGNFDGKIFSTKKSFNIGGWMSIKKEVKKDIISKFSINDNDTGSSEIQIAVLSERINNLTDHLKNHKH